MTTGAWATDSASASASASGTSVGESLTCHADPAVTIFAFVSHVIIINLITNMECIFHDG